jgi:hypothetical protein
MTRLLPEHVHAYLALLTQVSTTQARIVWKSVSGTDDPTMTGSTFSIINGRKYLKVVETAREGGRSVHAFIDKSNGDLIKAAGWHAPQRDKDGLAVRGNIATEEGRTAIWTRLLANPRDIYGHYLYK